MQYLYGNWRHIPFPFKVHQILHWKKSPIPQYRRNLQQVQHRLERQNLQWTHTGRQLLHPKECKSWNPSTCHQLCEDDQKTKLILILLYVCTIVVPHMLMLFSSAFFSFNIHCKSQITQKLPSFSPFWYVTNLSCMWRDRGWYMVW